MRRLIPVLALLLAVPACGPATKPAPTKDVPDTAIDRLLEAVKSRLDVMHDVARWKWSAHSPIEDPAREATLLADVAGRGDALGLDPAATRAVFAAQIEAAKLIQRADFARWESDRRDPEGKPPDLAGVLRPRIDALNRELLAALAEVRLGRGTAARIRARAEAILVGGGIDATVRDTAIRPLADARG
jgi:chorismate mutase